MYQYGNYLYPGQYSRTIFGAGTFSWQDPINSWKAGPGEVMTVEDKQTECLTNATAMHLIVLQQTILFRPT